MQPLSRIAQKKIDRLKYVLDQLKRSVSGAPAPRRVVFLHIPKCAGSSVNYVFKSTIGSGRSGRVVLVDDCFRPSSFERRLRQARTARFVGGHFGAETLEAVRGDAFTFTVLRDPFDRLRSTYGHFHSRLKGNPLAHKVPHMSIEEYLTSDDPEILQWTDNVVARQLAISHDRERARDWAPQQLVERALENLETLDLVVLFDDLAADIGVVARVAGVRYNGEMPRENVTSARASKVSSSAVSQLDGRLRELAMPRVSADLAVYAAMWKKRGRSLAAA